MPEKGKIAVLYPQRPFVHNDAGQVAQELAAKLRQEGWRVQLVGLPYTALTENQWLDSWFLCRLADLGESDGETIDCVVAFGAPACLVRHPNKVVLLDGRFSVPGPPAGAAGGPAAPDKFRADILRMGRQALREARRVYAVTEKDAELFKRETGMEVQPLLPPSDDPQQQRDVSGEAVWDVLVRELAFLMRPASENSVADKG